MKKLGNYRWVTCNRCGEKYVRTSLGKRHICKDLVGVNQKSLFERIKHIFK